MLIGELSNRERRGRKVSRMRYYIKGISRGSLLVDGQPRHECTNGVVNRLLMVISWFSKVPMKRRTVAGAHADSDEVHTNSLAKALAIEHDKQRKIV